MRIERIDAALERCDEHLSIAGAVDEVIESLLTQSLLILICAEFEKKYRELIIDRCSSVSDRSLRDYVENCTRTSFRSLKITEISGLLARFGSIHKAEFNRRLSEDGIKESYDSILNNRNRIAHGDGSDVTFRDIKKYYEKRHVVLDCFRESLRVEAAPARTVAGDVENEHG